MADFSKQWCEIHDSEGILPDFDILEIAKGLEKDHYTPYICEGFGFIAIGKDENGEIMLAMPTDEPPDEDGNSQVIWREYSDIVK